MKSSLLLLLAAAAAGGVLIAHHASASSSTAPKPPAGARVDQLPMPITGTGIPSLKRTTWTVAADASGQQAGTMILLQNTADPNDWVLTFQNASGGGAGILNYAKTPKGGLMAQAAAAGF
jgi:hypothetical protein